MFGNGVWNPETEPGQGATPTGFNLGTAASNVTIKGLVDPPFGTLQTPHDLSKNPQPHRLRRRNHIWQ
jgi:hypothetical protein